MNIKLTIITLGFFGFLSDIYAMDSLTDIIESAAKSSNFDYLCVRQLEGGKISNVFYLKFKSIDRCVDDVNKIIQLCNGVDGSIDVKKLISNNGFNEVVKTGENCDSNFSISSPIEPRLTMKNELTSTVYYDSKSSDGIKIVIFCFPK